MMNCRQVQDLLADYSVQVLEVRVHEHVEAHLAGCAPCREELRLLDATIALVETHGVRQPPPGLFNAVRNRIEAGDVRQEQPAWWLRWMNTTPARMSGMAVAAAALALGFLLPVGQSSLPPLDMFNGPAAGGGPVASNELGNSIRQHAMSHTEGPLADRVAWEAMAQLVSQDERRGRQPGVE